MAAPLTELEQLRQIVQELADRPMFHDNPNGADWCAFCCAYVPQGRESDTPHSDDCLWKRAVSVSYRSPEP